jgi:hypothetical protein
MDTARQVIAAGYKSCWIKPDVAKEATLCVNFKNHGDCSSFISEAAFGVRIL